MMNVQAQEGELFPVLVGETLEENTIELPKATEGKVTILGMAYSKKAESTLKTWYQPMYDKFVLKLGIFDQFYDVNMYFIPMYTGGKKAAYDLTMKKLKESNRTDLFPYILFYKGDMDPYLETLGMENKNLPYFFVLDEKGTVLYAAKGLFSEEKMEKIEEILDSRL
ncbi:MAG: hypothetical protein ACI9RU_001478 [Litorivivens sp.]